MRPPHRLRTWSAMLALFLIPLAATACGTLEVRFERAAAPDQSATSVDLTRAPERPGIPTPTPAAPLPELVYRTDDGIWKAGVTGQAVQILDRAEYGAHTVPAISPDGAYALYLKEDAGDLDLWLADLTVGGLRNLTGTPERVETNFRWWSARPDVVVFSVRPREAAPGPGVNGLLAVVGIDGNDYRVLDDRNDTGGLPAPSPDGQAIAYGSGSTGWLYLWDTGPQVFDPADYGLPSYREAQIASPSWSPDGGKLAWVVSGAFAEGGSLQMGVAVFDLGTRTAQLLHLHEAAFGDGWPPAPVWSPDGGWLAFTAWARDPDQAGVWVARVDEGQGEGYQSLFTEYHLGGSEPVWSPDGRWLAFHRALDDGGTGSWLAQVGTWGLIQLALPPDAYVVDWLGPAGTAGVLEQTDSSLQPEATPSLTATPMPSSTQPPVLRPSPTPLASTITLTYTCTYPWFFPNPPAACAGQPPTVSPTVAQRFERGLMLWRELPDVYGSQIYAFFSDDRWPYWNPTNDRWRSGMPETDPSIVPPPGYYQPVRGLGIFWREAFFGTIGLSARDRLGWATDEEVSLGELPMQCHANDGYLPRCYLAGPDVASSGDEVVYAIRPDNSWFVWEDPTAAPPPSTSPPISVPESLDCTSQECTETERPQLYEAQLVETASGARIEVTGSGGYLCLAGMCGLRYTDSESSFELTFDGEPAGSMGCHLDRCEGTLDVPADALLGTHTISVEGGSSITVEVTRG